MASNIRQLLNTSWTIHRLSPLHHEKEFPTLLANPSALQTYASRLRDQLTGSLVAGLGPQLGTATILGGVDDSLSKIGALKDCTWEMLSSWSQLTDAADLRSMRNAAGILVTLEYENTVYKAALLADPRGMHRAQEVESTSLPLLLTRFPNPLRQTFISFLSSNFDTYCSILRLPQAFLCSALERYFAVFASSDPRNTSLLGDAMREVHLTLSFSSSIAPDLRSLNISIPRGSLDSFLSALPSPEASEHDTAFLENLSAYLHKHLAMDIDLSTRSRSVPNSAKQNHVRLSRIACAAFVIGSEGRLKLVVPERKTANGDGTGDVEAEISNERGKKVLRASVALLHAVIGRAAGGQREGR